MEKKMGLSEDLKKVGETISAGEAKSITLPGLRNEFVHDGETVHYEIKIGKFGPYILTSLKDENGKDLMRSIPPTLFPGSFTDSDASDLVYPPEENNVILFDSYILKKGHYGDYLERISDGVKVTCPKSLKKDLTGLSKEYIEMLFSLPRVLGVDRENNSVTLKLGPYGFYASYNGKNIKVADPMTVTLSDILDGSESRMIKGEYDGKPISLAVGRYGLYIKWGDENIALPKEDRKEGASLTLERLGEIVEEHKKNGETGKKSEREFAPVDGTVPLLINGSYGYYIKWGKENVALSKEDKADPASLTDEKVSSLIAEYKEKPKTKKTFRRRKSTSK